MLVEGRKSDDIMDFLPAEKRKKNWYFIFSIFQTEAWISLNYTNTQQKIYNTIAIDGGSNALISSLPKMCALHETKGAAKNILMNILFSLPRY